jgi:hypothetical protein
MNINRHNYEEFFILYADNELSSEDRRMVDEFVLANPDLKDELDIYRNSILTPDTSLNFENKDSLLRYDESIISYIDNELPVDEKMQLEKLINGSPRLQQELSLYRQTKLQPDTEIVFENKSVLYRSTERRVVPMRMIRWAAAAAVLLAVSFSAVKYFNNKPGKTETGIAKATTDEKQIPSVVNPTDNIAKDQKKNENAIAQDNNGTVQPVADGKEKQNNLALIADKQKKNLPKEEKLQNVKLTDEKNREIIANNNQPPSNNLPTPKNNPYLDKGEEAIASNSGDKNQKIVNEAIADERNVTNPYSAPLYISNSTTIDTPVYTDDEDESKNKKSRGFFRKVTRFFEKNTGIKTTDDDKLRIAAFTVKLK